MSCYSGGSRSWRGSAMSKKRPSKTASMSLGSMRWLSQSWSIVWWKLQTKWGQCDRKAKRIELSTNLTQRQQIAVIVHETAHVALPYLVEEEICRLERFVMRSLLAANLLPPLEAQDDDNEWLSDVCEWEHSADTDASVSDTIKN